MYFDKGVCAVISVEAAVPGTHRQITQTLLKLQTSKLDHEKL